MFFVAVRYLALCVVRCCLSVYVVWCVVLDFVVQGWWSVCVVCLLFVVACSRCGLLFMICYSLCVVEWCAVLVGCVLCVVVWCVLCLLGVVGR